MSKKFTEYSQLNLSDVNTNASEIDDKGMSVEELNDPNKIKVTIAW